MHVQTYTTISRQQRERLARAIHVCERTLRRCYSGLPVWPVTHHAATAAAKRLGLPLPPPLAPKGKAQCPKRKPSRRCC